MREITFKEALNEALREELRRDERVFLMGEDIAIYGGAYGVTKGIMEDFGEERVRDTAISEACIVGSGVGAALTGMRPVVEIMYVDFMGICMDQVYNQAAKIRYMFGGKAQVPLTIRTQGGAGRSIAAHHSQSMEAWFLHVPVLKTVMPSTPYDAKGLLKSAIRDNNPVLFIEHKSMYNNEGPVPEEEYLIPLSQCDVKREGKDVTLVAHSRMAWYSIEACEELAEEDGIDVELIDPMTLNPLDIDTIVTSVKKTGRVVLAEEGYKTGGTGAEFGMLVMEKAFDYLDAPVERVASLDVPPPMSPVLEDAVIPNKEDIKEAVRRMVGR